MVVVFAPETPCSDLNFKNRSVLLVQYWPPEVVSESQMVPWLGRYRSGAFTQRPHPSLKKHKDLKLRCKA